MKEKNKLHTYLEIFLIATKLGFTSFGGPIAHLGYFHHEYVQRKRWIDDKSYADLVALCQFLPGPASSQVGIGIGVIRGGITGGILAFLGFTFPSVIALIAFALLLQGFGVQDLEWIHGLKLVAVAVVAHAIYSMAQKLTPDIITKGIALVSLGVVLLWESAFSQITIILLAGVLGFLLFKKIETDSKDAISFSLSKSFAIFCLILFFGLLFLLPILNRSFDSSWLAMFDSFYRSGSLVFGGGHVVLPLLEKEFVPSGLIGEEAFLAGYGAAQAVPGPLFTFAAYLGALTNGWTGGLVATIAIFLPAFLLVFGTLPFWNMIRKNKHIKGALVGINAAVVGILIAAFYQPIWTSTIIVSIDFLFASVLFFMLMYWKLPPWTIVLTGAIGGYLLTYL